MRAIYIFLGPPGAGKGTQAKKFSADQGIAHISTGDMLRASMQAGTEQGNQIKAIVDSGNLVSDDVVIDLIRDRISKADCENGFLLDGFPRTVPQAQALKQLLLESDEKLASAILFEVDEIELLARLSGRRDAEQRADDAEETQRKRIDVYHAQTAPLIAYYSEIGKLKRIDSNGTVEEVYEKLREVI